MILLRFLFSITYAMCINALNQTVYDFCNINESKTAYFIIKDIEEYFNKNSKKISNNEKCFLFNKKMINYYENFYHLQRVNKKSYNQFKCTECEKKFKNIGFLNLHFKIFHFNKDNLIDKLYCPADFCKILNCDRYKNYFSIPFPDNSKDSMTYSRSVKEKIEECNDSLVNFYRKTCMLLARNCFDSNENYFDYYKNFCLKIQCHEENTFNLMTQEKNKKQTTQNELRSESTLWEALQIIFMYIISIFSFIYILIIWVSHYS